MSRFIKLLLFQSMLFRAESSVNVSEYLRIPRIFHVEPYSECIADVGLKYSQPAYCIANVYIKPNETSNGWQILANASSPWKTQFRHDHLVFGMCINDCKKLLGQFDKMTQKQFYIPTPRNFSDLMSADPFVFHDAVQDKFDFGEVLNECINFNLRREFQLEAFTEIQYCNVADRPDSIDDADTAFVLLTAFIASLVGLSTLASFVLKPTQPSHRLIPPSVRNWLQSFSLRANYEALINHETHNDLDFIHSLKFLTMLLVILGHSVLLHSNVPFSNPQFIESKYRETVSMLILNGTMVIQTYFALSGFLLAVRFNEKFTDDRKAKVRDVGLAIAYRVMRLTPLYAFVMLFNATLMIRLGDGPFWRRVNEPEKLFCRTNFWTNFLFVNNYVHADEPCIQQSWYLAADFQLSILGLIILALITNFKQIKRAVMTVCCLLPPLILAFVTYDNSFDGVFITSPEAQRSLFWSDEMYHLVHVPTHTNADCYLTGLIVGLSFEKAKRKNVNLMNVKLFRFAYWFVFPIGVASLLISKIFYTVEFEKPSLWISLYAALWRKLWGVLIMILVIGCYSDKQSFIAKLLRNSVLVNFGKLTFAAYLIHVDVIKVLLGTVQVPVHLDEIRIAETTICSICLTYCVSFVIHLLVERPAANISRGFLASLITKSSQTTRDGLSKPSDNNLVEIFHPKPVE